MNRTAQPSRPLVRALLLVGLRALVLLLPATAAAQTEPDPAYWRLANVRAKLASWQAQHPDRLAVHTIGTSGRGEPIPAVCISDNVGTPEPEPRLIFHAAQHANECNGTTAVMRMIETLVFGYDDNPAVAARVDGLELWFVPIMNPDGHVHVFGGGTSWQDWRKTLRDNNGNGQPDFPDDGVDLNRNWDWWWEASAESDPASTQYKGPMPFSEPEAVALRDLILDRLPVLIVDYHSPVTITWRNYIFYPWLSQHGKGQSPDYPVARDIAETWAAATLDESGQPFRSAYAFDALPKQQCWSYGRLGILSFLMEISDQCWWTGADVDTIGARVARGSMVLLDRVLHGPGVRGTVTDAATGAVLPAEVQIAEMHQDYVGPRRCDGTFGGYYRLTLPGEYNLRVSCDGYRGDSLCVVVPDSGWAVADFALQPTASGVPAGPDDTGWLRFANPLAAGGVLSLATPVGAAPTRVELYDLRGRRIATLGEGLSAACLHTLRLPRRLPAGVYLLRARSGRQQQLRRVVLIP